MAPAASSPSRTSDPPAPLPHRPDVRRGPLLEVPPHAFRRLISSKPDLDNVFAAFSPAGPWSATVHSPRASDRRVPYSPEAMAMQGVVRRFQVPLPGSTWRTSRTPTRSSPASAPDGGRPAAGQHPHHRPPAHTPASSASTSGSASPAAPGFLADLVVVGAGPAGLAAAVTAPRRGSPRSPSTPWRSAARPAPAPASDYVGFPNGLGRRAGGPCRRPGQAARRPPECPLRAAGRGRRGLPRRQPGRRQRDPDPRGGRRVRARYRRLAVADL